MKLKFIGSVLLIAVVVGMVGLPAPTRAQDDLSATFESDTLTVNHPEGWIVDYFGDGDSLELASTEKASYDGGAFVSGDIYIEVTFYPPFLNDLLTTYGLNEVDALVGREMSADIEYGEVLTRTVLEQETAIVVATEQAYDYDTGEDVDNDYSLFGVVLEDGSLATVEVFAFPGEREAALEMAIAIVETIVFTPAEPLSTPKIAAGDVASLETPALAALSGNFVTSDEKFTFQFPEEWTPEDYTEQFTAEGIEASAVLFELEDGTVQLQALGFSSDVIFGTLPEAYRPTDVAGLIPFFAPYIYVPDYYSQDFETVYVEPVIFSMGDQEALFISSTDSYSQNVIIAMDNGDGSYVYFAMYVEDPEANDVASYIEILRAMAQSANYQP